VTSSPSRTASRATILLPRKKALRANEANKKVFEANRANIEADNANRRAEAEKASKGSTARRWC
jgi:ribosomal protein L9